MIVGKRKILALAVVAVLAIGALTGMAATEHWNDASLVSQGKIAVAGVNASASWGEWKNAWNQVKNDYTQVSLAPGSDQSQLNLGWYSKTPTPGGAKVKIADNRDMRQSKEFQGTSLVGTVISGTQYYSNKVTVKGLKPSHSYWYQVKTDGQWQDPQQYKTGKTDTVNIMFVGDPQIGASKGQVPAEGSVKQTSELATRNDAFNWNKMMNAALQQHPEINFMISAGDQINEVASKGSSDEIQQQEYQYAGFLSPAALRSLPVATTIGNHDSLTNGYGNHFNTPNPFTSEQNPTAAGHGYYYSYGSALFIVLNTNNYNAADHKTLIEKAIAANPSAKWRIVMIHQDVYGSGLDHSDSDGIILRTQLTPIFDAARIDVVLQGHDHTYARTYQLSGDGKTHESFGKAVKLGDESVKIDFLKENLCYNIVDKRQGIVKDPKGVFYMTANSATGSKFYELIPTQQDYIAKRNQTWRPTYSVINISGNQFSITTYDVATGKPIDDTYTIVKN